MAKYKDILITKKILDENPNFYFVFGDNTIRSGYGGAATLRDHPQAIGFITKQYPDNRDSSFFDVEQYKDLFYEELEKLEKLIISNPEKTFYISKLGAGLANRYRIWELLINPALNTTLSKFDNVIFCWEN